jgi:DNA-binding transcriptional regulator YiaG
MTRIDLLPRLPPLSVKALEDVQEVERFAHRNLRECGGPADYNFEKALRILRTCVITSLEVQMRFYASLRNYHSRWIQEIVEKAIDSTVGLVGMDGGYYYENFRNALHQTVGDYFKAEELKTREAEKSGKPKKATNIPNVIGGQIDTLREECRLPVEQLAEEIGLSVRSVYRHLSGEANPSSRHMAEYESFFSKRLSRTIKFKTSPKRQ